MALLKCPDCGHNVSDQAEACPACGYPVSKINTTSSSAPEQRPQPDDEQHTIQPTTPNQQPKRRVSFEVKALIAFIVALCLFSIWLPFSEVPSPPPVSERYEPKIPEPEIIVREDKEATQKRKAQAQAEINELRQYFRSNIDKVENIKWIYHKKTPNTSHDRAIYTYLGDRNGIVWARVVIGFQKEGWIHTNRIVINVDGTRYDIDVSSGEKDTETLWGSKIKEYVDFLPTPELEEIMWAVAKGKKVVVRFIGTQYRYDFEVSAQQKEALRYIWSYYKAKRVLGEIL